MLYRFTFTSKSDGPTLLTGVANGSSVVSAVHSSDQALILAFKGAQIAPFQRLRLLEAVAEARSQPGVGVCCEAVKLTKEQVELLDLRPQTPKVYE